MDNNLYQQIGELIGAINSINKNLEELKEKQNHDFESLQKEIKTIEKNVNQLQVKWYKMGGGMIAILSIGSFIGWFISNMIKLEGLLK